MLLEGTSSWKVSRRYRNLRPGVPSNQLSLIIAYRFQQGTPWLRICDSFRELALISKVFRGSFLVVSDISLRVFNDRRSGASYLMLLDSLSVQSISTAGTVLVLVVY